MKQKQEVWRFDEDGKLRARTDCDWADFAAAVADHNWHIYSLPMVGGIMLDLAFGTCDYNGAAKRAVALEIRRQLAAHGKRVEIRRVSR